MVLREAIKCNPYSETTVESRTQLKTVKITLNIFAVCCISHQNAANIIYFLRNGVNTYVVFRHMYLQVINNDIDTWI